MAEDGIQWEINWKGRPSQILHGLSLNCLVCHPKSLCVILQEMGSKLRFVAWSWI